MLIETLRLGSRECIHHTVLSWILLGYCREDRYESRLKRGKQARVGFAHSTDSTETNLTFGFGVDCVKFMFEHGHQTPKLQFVGPRCKHQVEVWPVTREMLDCLFGFLTCLVWFFGVFGLDFRFFGLFCKNNDPCSTTHKRPVVGTSMRTTT